MYFCILFKKRKKQTLGLKPKLVVVFEGQIDSQINIRDFVILESCDFFLYFFVMFSDFFV